MQQLDTREAGIWSHAALASVLTSLSQRSSWWPPDPPAAGAESGRGSVREQLVTLPLTVLPMAMLLLIYAVRVSDLVALRPENWDGGARRLRFRTGMGVDRDLEIDAITAGMVEVACRQERARAELPLFSLWGRRPWSEMQVGEVMLPALKGLGHQSLRRAHQMALLRALYPEHAGDTSAVADARWRVVMEQIRLHLEATAPRALGSGARPRFLRWSGFDSRGRLDLLRQHGLERWRVANYARTPGSFTKQSRLELERQLRPGGGQ
jgi:hypothetical protein